jgi:hypothetical protein
VENPFRYGTVATGAYFTDREADLAELEADIRSGQNVVIISARRYGRTPNMPATLRFGNPFPRISDCF